MVSSILCILTPSSKHVTKNSSNQSKRTYSVILIMPQSIWSVVVVFVESSKGHMHVFCILIYFIVRFYMYKYKCASVLSNKTTLSSYDSTICAAAAAGVAFICVFFLLIHINNFILEMTLNWHTTRHFRHTQTYKHFSISIQFNCFEQLMSVSIVLLNRECNFIWTHNDLHVALHYTKV